MSDKPTERQIASYLRWLKNSEGDANLQIDLPLDGGNVADAVPDSQDLMKRIPHDPAPSPIEKRNLTASQAVARVRVLAISGMPIRDISIRTGMHEKYIETVIHSPGQLNRRYE